jgi:hypothetical protein
MQCNALVELNKAVFLSYAKQDAAAAARICDALRAGRPTPRRCQQLIQ